MYVSFCLQSVVLLLCVPSWCAHPQVKVLHYVLRWVRLSRPSSVLFENVQGLRCVDKGSDRSPLQWIQSELESLGYSVAAVDMDMSAFHAVTRKRTALWGTILSDCKVATSSHLPFEASSSQIPEYVLRNLWGRYKSG